MKTIDLEALTPEELAALGAKIDEKRQAEKNRINADREAYKKMKDEAIIHWFNHLKRVSNVMVSSKKNVFDGFETLIQMKDSLFNTKTDRKSNSFTSEDGNVTIKLGNRINEGWADEVEVGVSKVQDYLRTLAKDDNSAALVESVIRLLKPDRKGNLKASKVLELEQMALKSKNADFLDGINIIKEAYRPSPSCQFIEVRYKDENGKEQNLALSMSAID